MSGIRGLRSGRLRAGPQGAPVRRTAGKTGGGNAGPRWLRPTRGRNNRPTPAATTRNAQLPGSRCGEGALEDDVHCRRYIGVVPRPHVWRGQKTSSQSGENMVARGRAAPARAPGIQPDFARRHGRPPMPPTGHSGPAVAGRAFSVRGLPGPCPPVVRGRALRARRRWRRRLWRRSNSALPKLYLLRPLCPRRCGPQRRRASSRPARAAVSRPEGGHANGLSADRRPGLKQKRRCCFSAPHAHAHGALREGGLGRG